MLGTGPEPWHVRQGELGQTPTELASPHLAAEHQDLQTSEVGYTPTEHHAMVLDLTAETLGLAPVYGNRILGVEHGDFNPPLAGARAQRQLDFPVNDNYIAPFGA